MAHNRVDEQHAGPSAQARAQGRAAGIYGAIITASIMAAAGNSLTTPALALSVLTTLVVYWLAERYAEVLGKQAADGRLPTWRHIRVALAGSWPIVSASFTPLLALLAARLAGATASSAATVGVVTALVLLTIHGWAAARAAELHGWRLAAATSVAAALGLVMVVLKNFVILHLH
jgi:hypothetical protein